MSVGPVGSHQTRYCRFARLATDWSVNDVADWPILVDFIDWPVWPGVNDNPASWAHWSIIALFVPSYLRPDIYRRFSRAQWHWYPTDWVNLGGRILCVHGVTAVNSCSVMTCLYSRRTWANIITTHIHWQSINIFNLCEAMRNIEKSVAKFSICKWFCAEPTAICIF